MDKVYWLGRKRATLRLARESTSSEAMLAYYDLAGRYGLKALFAQSQATDLAERLPPPLYAGRSRSTVQGAGDD